MLSLQPSVRIEWVICVLRVISGKYKGLKLNEVDRDDTRPTTDKNKESLFNILGQYFSGGEALDLFAGSGALGIEALSRGMDRCTFVDNGTNPCKTIRCNTDRLNLHDRVSIIRQDVFTYLEQVRNHAFQLILIDPPYKFTKHTELLAKIELVALLDKDGTLVIETEKTTDLHQTYGKMERIKEKISGITKFSFYAIKEDEI